ncbi:MAG: hypothetical protein ACRCWJ_16615 [Casimicrobium sp.]
MIQTPAVDVREFLYADEVARADAQAGLPPQREYDYEFSGGRRITASGTLYDFVIGNPVAWGASQAQMTWGNLTPVLWG